MLRSTVTWLLLSAPCALAQGVRVDTTVRTVERPLHPGVATLVEELSIGVEDGAEEYVLGEIADIALGRDGSIYAFDRQVPVIRQYDAQGKFVRSIGRRGEGPGEYRSVSGLAVAADGRLLVWDTGNWRINVYSSSGEVLTQWLTPSGSGGSSMATYARAILVDNAGRIVTRKMIFNAADIRNRPTVWLRFRADGSPLDTLRAPDFRDVPELMATSGRATVTREVPFMPKRFVTLSPLGSFIAGYPERYAFEIHHPDGRVVSIRRDVRPEPVSRAERASARREVEERMRQTDPTWSWNGPDIPDVKPLYGDLQVALDGRIWVAVIPEVSPRVGASSSGGGVGPSRAPRRRPQGPPPPDPRPALYDVFEPDGQY
ncbi:MAG TPA: 6-bladed beta-propeller, partial [Gemmatimonadaceae bacterium]